MIDPKKAAENAAEREEENMRFRTFLLEHADEEELDKQFLALHHELFAWYDCCQCNNCCHGYVIALEEDEIEAIAAAHGVSKQEFARQYLVYTIEGYCVKATDKRCCFLKEDGKCAIQGYKPAECTEFPFTHRPKRLSNMLGMVKFAKECPILIEILERLKTIYGFEANGSSEPIV